ncbi:MAG: helix-turn-helix transcriptional regulator [Spirochaetales bacterium]|nr:helix-turn-helix transcriptional regulator [Candidatus Physcosoma equi]
MSDKETAEKWGVSTRRVNYLIQKGKIKGAVLVGKSWLLPLDAEKPMDGRRKETQFSPRFPLLVFQDYKENDLRLNEEERLLFKGQKLCIKGEFQKSSDILLGLLASSSSSSVQMGAAYYMIINAIFLSDMRHIDTYLAAFSEKAIPETAPEEMRYLRYDIETYTKGNRNLLEKFSIDPLYHYSLDALPYITVLEAYRSIVTANSDKKSRSSIHELLAVSYERAGYAATAYRIYLYLALRYELIGEKKKATVCAQKGIELAFQEESYVAFVTINRVAPKFFETVMKNRSKEERVFIQDLTERYIKGMQALLNHQKRSAFDFGLQGRDYDLLFYALEGKTNKEIANSLKVSENSVNKYYTLLYEKVGVQNKQELLALYHRNLQEFLKTE